jgi:hypothetical protein
MQAKTLTLSAFIARVRQDATCTFRAKSPYRLARVWDRSNPVQSAGPAD